MHPSKAIRGRTTRLLEGKHVLIGVSGSIAAIEVPRVIRELVRHGAEVDAVMSPESLRIISPEAVQFATGRPPILQLTGNVEHVTLLGPGEGRVDLLLLAPATANTLSKVAHGIDDTPVTSCASVALGGGVPILAAPAMHSHMMQNPALKENLERLRGWGVGIISGASAEGEEKVASPEEVAAAVLHRLAQGPWKGRKVVVIGGAAHEPIDEVRSVTNESSGASAVALANQAYYRGAEVELWLGAVRVPAPSWVATFPWGSVEDLRALVRQRRRELREAAAVLVPAALSDFTLDKRSGKIPSREHPTLTLTLRQAPKVLPEVRRLAPSPTRLVAFKLESGRSPEEMQQEGERLRSETGADWVVANDARTMGSPDTEALVLPRAGMRHWIRGPKAEFAGKLLDDLGRELVNLSGPASPGPIGGRSHRRRSSRRRARGG